MAFFITHLDDRDGPSLCGVLQEDRTVERLKSLLPDMAPYRIERFERPNLRALNFVIHGVPGEGASANHRIDRQAKSLGD